MSNTKDSDSSILKLPTNTDNHFESIKTFFMDRSNNNAQNTGTGKSKEKSIVMLKSKMAVVF